MSAAPVAAFPVRSGRRERTGSAAFTDRWWRRSLRMPADMGGRALSLLFLVGFGLAAVAPPCETHDAAHGGGHTALGGESRHDHGGDGDHGSGEECTCLDDCQLSATLAIRSPDPSLPGVDIESLAVWPKPAAPRLNQPFILPFGTAPPIGG